MKVSSFRIISLIIAITLLFQPLSVFANSDDTVTSENVDDIISIYASQIKQLTVEFFNDYSIEVDSIDSLYSGFVAFWKVAKAPALYGLSITKTVSSLCYDFIIYLRDNYFYGYFDNGEEIHYVSPAGKLPSHSKPSPHSSTTHTPNDNFYPFGSGVNIYEMGFTGQYPFDSPNKTYYQNLDFSYPTSPLSEEICSGKNGIYMLTYRNQEQLEGSCAYINQDNYIGKVIAQSGHTYIQFYQMEIVDHKLYYHDATFGTNVVGKCFYNSGTLTNQLYSTSNPTYWPSPEYTKSIGKPISFYGQKEYNCIWGNWILDTGSYFVLYYQNQFINCNGLTGSDGHGSYIDLSSTILWNTTYIDNAINNYNTVINNIINNYPTISPDLFLYILNDYLSKIPNIDYSEYLEELSNRISELEDLLNSELEDIQNIKSTLVKVKNYLKNIDTNITHIMERFDSLFLQSGIFFLDAKLDYLYNHLSSDMTRNTNAIISALNNISISSNGGSSGDINFGDLIIDLDASLNLLFSLNNEQKSEIESDIDTIKAPFSWIGTLGNNINTLLTKMVNRSASYSGDAVTGNFGDFGNIFVSENQANSPENGSNRMSSRSNSSNSEYPVIYLHFGNSTSDIYYGGDVPAIDFSWYQPYKSIVDNVIVVFAWAFAVICFYRSLPSLLDGGSAKENKGDN